MKCGGNLLGHWPREVMQHILSTMLPTTYDLWRDEQSNFM